MVDIDIKRLKLFILGIIFAIIMSVSGIYALTNTETMEVKKSLRTGAVNIKITEYTSDNSGNESLYNEEKKNVMPGDEISLIPKVNNLGVDCYIRVKFNLVIGNNVINISENNCIKGISNNLRKQNEYYYYNSVVKTGETIELFNIFKIPNDITTDGQENEIKLNIIAEAIQASNFEPDYTKDDPWQGIEIEECIDSTYSLNENQTLTPVQTIYENDAQKYIQIPEDFFKDLSTMLPGDSIGQVIKISNKLDRKLECFYTIDLQDELTDRQKALLENCNLTILRNEGTTIYDGKLYTGKINSLGEYEAEKNAKLKFIIKIPKELGNQYSNLDIKLKWKFSVQYEEVENEKDNTIGNTNSSNDSRTGNGKNNIIRNTNSSNDSNTGNGKNNIINNSTNPKTGDFKFNLSITLFFISAIGLIVIFILEYREKKNSK